MSLRVIAGQAKGRKLKPVPGDSTRPIMDRAKEALFSILGPSIVGTSMLDLFGGTGSVGIEALSRGADHVVFYDLDRKAIQTIHENLRITRLDDKATVRMADAFSVLKRRPELPFDYVFIAPPQYKGMWLQALKLVDEQPDWGTTETLYIIQIDPSEYEDILLKTLCEIDRRRYGKTMILFYERCTPAEKDTP